MADTLQELPALIRSNDPQYKSEALNRRDIPGIGSDLLPAPAIDVTLPISAAMLSCIAVAANTSYALHNRVNGSTVSMIYGDMAGLKLFSVSIYPSRSISLWERPSWETLFEYIKANLDLLLRPGHALGTWFNDYECVHCLDVVVLVGDREAASDLGLRFDQLAFFDLEARQEILIRHPRLEPAPKLAGVGND